MPDADAALDERAVVVGTAVRDAVGHRRDLVSAAPGVPSKRTMPTMPHMLRPPRATTSR